MFSTSGDFSGLQKKVNELEKECERLQVENSELKRQLSAKKEVRIYDYVDDQVEMLQRMYAKRKSGYRAMGYLISDNGNSESDMFG